MRSRMHLAATEAEDFITNSEDNDNYMYGDHTNEQVVQVNEKVMCRSRFVIFMNSGPQSKANKRGVRLICGTADRGTCGTCGTAGTCGTLAEPIFFVIKLKKNNKNSNNKNVYEWFSS